MNEDRFIAMMRGEAEEKFACIICGERIKTEDEVAEVTFKALAGKTHADCMMEALNQ